jgi:hypothetical protein
MNMQMNDKFDDMWGNLVAADCGEYLNGDLAFSDAVEDLFLLGYDSDEAREKLLVGSAPDPMKHMTLEPIGV